MPTETGVTSILGIENQVNKNQPNGYAGLDSSTKLIVVQLPSVVEQNTNKNQANGYPSLDSNGLVPLTELPPYSIIPVGVSVAGYIPYMDDAVTYMNLIYVESGYYIALDTATEKFTMVKL